MMCPREGGHHISPSCPTGAIERCVDFNPWSALVAVLTALCGGLFGHYVSRKNAVDGHDSQERQAFYDALLRRVGVLESRCDTLEKELDAEQDARRELETRCSSLQTSLESANLRLEEEILARRALERRCETLEAELIEVCDQRDAWMQEAMALRMAKGLAETSDTIRRPPGSDDNG